MSQALKKLEHTFWSFDSETNRQVIGAYLTLESQADFDHLRSDIQALVEKLPRLSEKIEVSGRSTPSWSEDESFNLNNHLFYRYCPAIKNRSELTTEISTAFQEPIEKGKPLWQIQLISNKPLSLKYGDAISAMLVKIHHCFGDGLTMAEIMMSISSKSAYQTAKPSKDFLNSTNHPNNSKLKISELLTSFTTVIKDARRPKVLSPITGQSSENRNLLKIDIPSKHFEPLRKQLKVTSNDLALSLISEAAACYCKEMGEEVKNINPIVPFNTRGKNDKAAFGNFLGIGKIEINCSNTIVESLKEIKSQLKKIKKDKSYKAYETISCLSTWIPKNIVKSIVNLQTRGCSMVCTNVPWSSKKERFVGGTKVTGSYGIVALLEGQGLGFTISQYSNKVCISLVFDPSIIKEPARLYEKLRDAKNQLASGGNLRYKAS